MRLAGTCTAILSLLFLAACGGGEDEAPSIDTPYTNYFDGDGPTAGWLFYNPSDSDTPPGPDVTTLWSVDADSADAPGGPTFSGSFSLNFNNGTDYNGANNGVAISPKMNISDLTAPVLFFRCNYQTESPGTSYDKRFVRIGYFEDGESTYYYEGQLSTTEGSDAVENCAAMGEWHFHVIGMNPNWDVLKLRVAFQFDSVDGYANNFAGWFIDDFFVGEAADLADLINANGNGDDNTGDDNTGDDNTGDDNTGDDTTTTGTTIFTEDFQGATALSTWTLSNTDDAVKWAADSTPAEPFGDSATLNYNDGTNYQGSGENSGSAKTPQVDLTDYISGTLTFKCNYQTETLAANAGSNYDQRHVRIYQVGSTDPVVTQQLYTNGDAEGAFGNCGEAGSWHTHTIDLTASWGAIQVEFFFDSYDGVANAYAGWAVDDITVTATSSTAGDDNTGDDNTGDDNTGDDNTGDDNTGDDNTGDDNTGDDNTGDDNTGDDTPVATDFFSTDFEGDLTESGWTLESTDAEVIWAFDGTPNPFFGSDDTAIMPFVSGAASLNYNNGTDYASTEANSGTATSPSIDLTDLQNPKLVFLCNFQVESSAADADNTFGDWRTLRILAVGTDAETPLVEGKLGTVNFYPSFGACSDMGTWHTHTIELDPTWGAVQVQFDFNTNDATANGSSGWAIDDFAITSEGSTGVVKSSSESAPADDDDDSSSCGGSIVSSASLLGWPLMIFGLLLVAGGFRFRRVLG